MEGINSRLDGMQAAILNVKLSYIVKWTDKRIENAKLYDNHLKDVSQVEIPKVRDNVKHSYHLYVIKTDRRDELAAYLKQNGVDTAIHYPIALHNMNAYKYLNYTRSDFPNASFNEGKILSLPMYPELAEEQIAYIVNKITAFFKI
jgi:dTDP-4-amino-4,6-dideoxygalactose transaminase